MRKDLEWVAARSRTAGTVALCLVLAGAAACGDDKDDGLSGTAGDLKHHGANKDAAAPAPVDAALPLDNDASSQSDPCVLAACAADERCELKQVECIRAPCPPVASCVPAEPAPQDAGSAPTSCAVVSCKTGTTCVESQAGASCVETEPGDPSCAATECEAGTHCELHQVQCIRAPCPPQPTCVVDVDPCAAVRCQSGTHCESHVVQCFAAPCPPVTDCVAD